ncbi:MAG: hypothetical protein AB7O24_26530 [Kofleriaceae bacterium]
MTLPPLRGGAFTRCARARQRDVRDAAEAHREAMRPQVVEPAWMIN